MYYFVLADNLKDEGILILEYLYNLLKKEIINFNYIFSNYIPRIEEGKQDNKIYQATFFEFFQFCHYLNSKGIKLEKIKPIDKFAIFWVGKKLYILFRDFDKIEFKRLTKKDYIISLRRYFFNQLYEILSNFVNMVIPDRVEYNSGFDKLSLVSKIVKNKGMNFLKKVMGNYIGMVYYSDKSLLKNVVKYLIRIYKCNKFVIKYPFGEMGKQVYTFDMKDEFIVSKLYSVLKKYENIPLLIQPFFEQKGEYRVYYVFNNDKVKIFSIKQKVNTNLKEAFQKGRMDLASLNTEFIYIDKLNDKYLSFVENIAKAIGWKVGVMEFVEDQYGNNYLMEVNHLGGLLTCNDKDIQKIRNFYTSLYKTLLI